MDGMSKGMECVGVTERDEEEKPLINGHMMGNNLKKKRKKNLVVIKLISELKKPFF